MCKTDEYNAWQHIRSRCYNKNSPAYPEYGGRGITVCDRWLESFENFYADMGPKPSRKHSIDRYPDNDGPYSPSNCRWATRAEQNRNTRQNVILEFNGKRMCLTEWADLLGICKTTLFARIQRDGWSVERALTTPADPAAGRFLPEPVTHNGRTMSVKDWARETGICYGTIKSRLRKGWTVDEALSISPQRTGHRSKLKPGS